MKAAAVTQAVRSPLPQTTAQRAVAWEIAGLLPPHDHFLDLTGAGLDVVFAKPPSMTETINDEGTLHTFWKVLRERPAELARVCMLTPHSRAAHAEGLAAAQAGSGSQSRDRELEIARGLWVALCQSEACSDRKARPRWRSWVRAGVVAGLDGWVETMALAADRLHRVSLDCRAPAVVLKEWRPRKRVCVYADLRDESAWWLSMAARGGQGALVAVLREYPARVVLRVSSEQEVPPGWAMAGLADETVLCSQQALVAQPPLFPRETEGLWQ